MKRNLMSVRYNGYWEGCEYKDGEEQFLFIPPRGMSHSELLEAIDDIVDADKNNYDYVLFSLMKTKENRKVKMRIKNDRDLEVVLATFQEPEIFVISKRKNAGTNPPFVLSSQYGWQAGGSDRNEQGFVDLMVSQNMYSCPMLAGVPFPTMYGMNYMQCSIPFGNQPSFPSVFQPWSVPYVNQQGPIHAPNLYRPRPSPAAFAHLPRHDSAPYVDQPVLSSIAFIEQSQPRQQPTYAENVEQRERFSSPIVDQKEPCPKPNFDQSRPSSTPRIDKVGGISVPNVNDENERVPDLGDYGDRFEESNDGGDGNEGIREKVVRPPQSSRQSNRRKTRRISSGTESSSHSQTKVCPRCRQSRHNGVNCTEFIPVTVGSETESCEVEQPTNSRRRQQRRCSICRLTGHTWRKCRGGES